MNPELNRFFWLLQRIELNQVVWFFIVEKNLNESNISFCSEITNESRIQKLVNRTGLVASPFVKRLEDRIPKLKLTI